MKGIFAMIAVLFTNTLAFAQAAAVAVVAQPTYLDSVLAWIGNNATGVASVLGLLEVVLRVVPSQKPLSILVPVKYALSGLAVISGFLSDICDKLISSLNASSNPPAKS